MGREESSGRVTPEQAAAVRRFARLWTQRAASPDDAARDVEARVDAAATLLAPLSEPDRNRLVDAIATVERLLAPTPPDGAPFVLRGPSPGDLGWVVERHGAVYAAEHGWDARFEALVARVVADFVDQLDPERERCWIAVRGRGSERVGSAFLVRHPERDGVAQLRLLLVEPSARGLGLGARLVDECRRFARESGYHTITLWTQRTLVAARRIYAAAGYRLVRTEPHTRFGPTLDAETWELTL